MLDQPVEMAFHGGRDIRSIRDQPDLDIPKLRRLGEIGRADERPLAVDDHALCMEAGTRYITRVEASGIIEDLGYPWARPLLFDEPFGKPPQQRARPCRVSGCAPDIEAEAPPGDSDVISHVDRLSSNETKIAPRSLRIALGASRW